MPSCSQTCRRRPLHPPLPLQSANSPYHFCDRTYSSLFPPFFSRTRSSDNLTPRRHWCDPDILLLTNGNDSPQARFQPARVVSPPPLHPSSGSNLLSLLCFFSSMQHHPNDFSLSPTRTAEGRILSSVSSPAEFLTSKPAQPPKDCAGSFFSLFMLPLRFLFLPSVSKNLQKKARRQHPYQLPDKPQRQSSEAVNPFLKILIKAPEPLFSASPQSSGLAARASPAPPASSSHRSGFPPRSAARPSAWPVLPLHRSK